MAEFDDRFKNYASAGLRWGLCLEDHPDVKRTYTEASGRDLGGAYAVRWPDTPFVVCTLTIPGHAEQHVGVKEIPKMVKRKNQAAVAWENTVDNYLVLQTQACGRALRSAGYPHSVPDLKLVMLWRRRNAEVDSLALEKALDAAGGEEDDDDEDEAPRQATGGPITNPPRTANESGPEEVFATVRKPQAGVVDVMAPLLTDDAMSGMWDQMTEAVRAECRTYVADKGGRPGTVRAYMKWLLDREHTAAMKDHTPTANAPSMQIGDAESMAAGKPKEQMAESWVDRDAAAIANPKPQGDPVAQDPEHEALLEAVAEVRGRMVSLAGDRPNDYAKFVTELEKVGIAVNQHITMEQLIQADEILGGFEAPV